MTAQPPFPRPDFGPLGGGAWSAYYCNGHIHSNDIAKGFDVLKITDRRADSATTVRMRELNVQTEPDYR
ncbi:hypothetical protein ACF082_26630 [Streptomyces lydicus]|uniref:hypothetical protein n=1 Tax=Streptomyces lydicus TaxID=47763 RepID=UPI0036FF99CA